MAFKGGNRITRSEQQTMNELFDLISSSIKKPVKQVVARDSNSSSKPKYVTQAEGMARKENFAKRHAADARGYDPFSARPGQPLSRVRTSKEIESGWGRG